MHCVSLNILYSGIDIHFSLWLLSFKWLSFLFTVVIILLKTYQGHHSVICFQILKYFYKRKIYVNIMTRDTSF